MSLFVKICGLANRADVDAVAALAPDAMGFVFWPGSRRFVTADDVAEWTRHCPSSILKAGVFVDTPAPDMERIVEVAGLDVVQLHGFQSLEKTLKNFPMFGKRSDSLSSPARWVSVWRVVHLNRVESAGDDSGHVDAYVVDSYSELSPGGTGKTCDWPAARDFVQRSPKPVLLAGGLTPANVEDAIEAVNPWGVDVSSGVEASPGRKDIRLVERFIEACRRN